MNSDNNLPKHIAIIMDGNGRWAKSKNLPRVEGHRTGAKSVRVVVEEARKLGIKYLTLFSFSTENWNRPKDEVSALMKLFKQYLDGELSQLLKNGVRLRAIGDLQRLPDFVRESLDRNQKETEHLDGLQLILALSYGGREEIVSAARKLATQAKAGLIDPNLINEELFSENLYSKDIPDPDLLIRTSAENRISNFLLWQLAYAEIVVSPVLWPDFRQAEFAACLEEYAKRERRFGLTSEQINKAKGSD